MSAGDIDDTLGSAAELLRLQRNYPLMAAYIGSIHALAINHSFDIPLGAGISQDGTIRYIDRHIQTRLNNWDLSPVLATHESVEWALVKWASMPYPEAHRLANRAEHDELFKLFPQVTWKLYSEFINPQVKGVEGEWVTMMPPNLAMYPYKGTAE